jgi:hypothetical protein
MDNDNDIGVPQESLDWAQRGRKPAAAKPAPATAKARKSVTTPKPVTPVTARRVSADPEFQKLFKVVSDKYPSLSHQQRYYRTQRVLDEQREKVGNAAATREAGRIHQKTGRKLTGAEGDLLSKPGANENEQMLNVAMALDYPIAMGRVAGAVPIAEQAASRVGRALATRTAPAAARTASRVAGKASVEDAGGRAALGRSRAALAPGRKAATKSVIEPKPRARPKTVEKSEPTVQRKTQTLGEKIKSRASTAKGTGSPRAEGRSLRQRGVSPRQLDQWRKVLPHQERAEFDKMTLKEKEAFIKDRNDRAEYLRTHRS